MAKLIFRIQSDWEEVVRLRNEIAKLKQELMSMDGTQSPAAFKALNVQLAASNQRLDELVTNAAKAGAEMETGFKKGIYDGEKAVNSLSEEIIKQKDIIRETQNDVSMLTEQYKKLGKYGHAEAKGIAFSYIYFDQQNRQICVAACDLGLGIPYTLRRSGLEYKSDGEALRQSLEIGVSAKTNKHNKGFGLDNVVSNLSNKDRLRIVSNKALLLCHPNKNPIKFYELNFDFKGTLIYFEISIDSFLEEETLFDISLG